MSDMKKHARWAGVVALFALTAGCGGGGQGPHLPTPGGHSPSPAPMQATEYNAPTGSGNNLAARYGAIDISAYAELGNPGSVTVASGNGLLTLSGSVPAGNTYGGFLADLYPPASTYDSGAGVGRIAAQDYSSQAALRIVAGSSDATQLQVQLQPQGGPFNGCVPTANLPVNSTVQNVTLPLDAGTWSIPAHCSEQERSLTLAQALQHLEVVTVGITQNQVAGLADGHVRSFTVGSISFLGQAAATLDRSEVSTFNKPNGSGNSLAALFGSFRADTFSQNGDQLASTAQGFALATSSVTVPAGNGWGGLMLDAAGPGSTWDAANGTGEIVEGHYGDWTRLRIQVGSDTASPVLVRLYPASGPFDSCVPSYVLAVDGMAVSRDISLTDPAWFVPDYCAAEDRARTALQAVSDLRSIAVGVTERSVPGIADGNARRFTLGEIAFSR